MSWFRFAILLLATVGIGHGAVTAAWKVPLEGIAPLWEAGKPPPLGKPPGESGFFLPGDELFDLSALLQRKAGEESRPEDAAVAGGEPRENGWHGDWVVWNARSESIVARGSWNDIFSAERVLKFREIPLVVRTRFDLVTATDVRSLAMISRSSEKAELELNGLRAEIEVVLGSVESPVIDSPLKVSWSGNGIHGGWEVVTAVSFREGRRCRLARHGSGESVWELFVSFDRELLDGSRWVEARSIESEKGPVPWPLQHDHALPSRHQLGPDRWVGLYGANADSIMRYLDEEGEGVAVEFKPPEEVSEWVRGPLVDIRKLMDGLGVRIRGEGSFAGLDPISQRVYVVTDQVNQGLVEILFGDCLHCCGDPPIWIETNPGSGGWGLACRSGERAHIGKTAGETPGSDLRFEIEPTRGGSGLIFDLRYELDLLSGMTKAGRLSSAATLIKDKPQVIGSGSGPGGKEVKVILTALDAGE